MGFAAPWWPTWSKVSKGFSRELEIHRASATGRQSKPQAEGSAQALTATAEDGSFPRDHPSPFENNPVMVSGLFANKELDRQ